eukprot:TRINITY_DN72861_c0_g1_i1.p2 TRINITY_DN72861_c0_g1~~TRINITY_DN72861_c0_g1_i1.p2  ORF type:complete len:171 (+),score=60.67 TRINITY_DN72861_c0_g1_i1:87-599(+)
MEGRLPEHYSVLQAGEVPEDARVDFCKMKQADRYHMAKSLEKLRGPEGIVPALEVDTWCREVRKRRQAAQAKDAAPRIRRVAGTRRIRKGDDDFWGTGPDPWLPYVTGVFFGIAIIATLAFCLYFKYLDRHHFHPAYWWSAVSTLSWRQLYASLFSSESTGAAGYRPTFS